MKTLWLINLIDFRASIAQGHVQFMNDLKVKTEMMLQAIRGQE
ncbi:MAG: hypothetical protein ACON34_08690 [Flavobacteriales bacterium]